MTLVRLQTLCAVGFALLLFPVTATAQTKAPQPKTPTQPKTTVKAAPPAAVPAPKVAEPATPEEAARVLDLRTFPRMEDAKLGGHLTLGLLMYDAKATPKAAFEFQQREFTKRGFKELPGGYRSAMTNTGTFTKDGFFVAVSSYENSGDPQKAGLASVTLVNHGNVAVEKLPVPPGVKPFHPQPTEASYTTDAKVAETAAACRKLLLAAGWEPYGEAGEEMQYFKRNAVKLQSWVSSTPAEGGKTLIRYDTELLTVDLPVPPDAGDPRYTDYQKTLRFAAPQDQTDAIFTFYQQRLTKLGWKATTEKPVSDDRKTFLVFRNPQKEILWLDLERYTDSVQVTLRHQTAAELAEDERLADARAAAEKLAEAKRNMKVNVAIPLPAKAANLEKTEASLFEFTLPTGSGPATLTAFREHFRKEGWTEEKGAEFMKNTGSLDFTKGEARLGFSYFDVGFGDVEIRVSASRNVILEAVASKDKPPADAPMAKAKTPAIPGLPALPPGVELPADVEALLKKALEDAGKVGPPGKKLAPKKAAP